jgi:prepilin peptidase dependent protein B
MRAGRCALGARAGERGASLVELMVGVVVGLFIVAGVAAFAAGFSSASRRLVLEARLTQDLRAAMDIVTGELRRAGYWQNAASGVAPADAAASAAAYEFTGFAALTPEGPASTPGVVYAYDRSAAPVASVADRASFGLIKGVLTSSIGASGEQPLTDGATTLVTAFDVRAQSLVEAMSCPTGCAAAGCPSLAVRQLAVTLRAQSTVDPAVRRTLVGRVRVRNDQPTGACLPA